MTDRQFKWDLRFLNLAAMVAGWSKDPSTKVGAVLTRNNRVLGTGYNGFPPGADDDPKLYADREYKYKHVVHAERNALDFAEVQDVEGACLYTSFPCCPRCTEAAADRGVARIVMLPLPIEGRNSEWVTQWRGWIAESFRIARHRGMEMAAVVLDDV